MLKHNSSMKVRWIGIAMSVFFLVGIAAFTQILVRYDQKNKIRDILNKGNSLVSLIALHPLKNLNGQKSEFFLRTLSEYISSEGLVYCFIHDRHAKPLLSLAPRDLISNIPESIQVKSLYTMGLTMQIFSVSGTEGTFYEFAKPVFENGERNGTVRIGLKLPPTSIFNSERIGLLAMIAFLIFATITFAYYGMTSAFRPLRNISHDFNNSCMCIPLLPAPSNSEKNRGMLQIIRDLEQSFFQIKETLNKTETDNVEIATRLGVTTFEKDQISKIIDSIKFGIIITDIQDNISYMNSYMLRLLDKKRGDVVDHPLGEVLEHDEITSFISQQESLNSTSNSEHIEITFPDLSPGEIFQVSSSYMRDNEGAIIGKMISIKNITREKSSEKVKNEFIANVAHEFLTPLTTIKSYNEMLMDGEIENEEMQKEFFNTISEETGRLSRLIQNLLSLSKIEMGSLTLSTSLVKTDWLVGDSIVAVEKAAQRKNMVITKIMPDQFPSLVGDKELLKTAIINILGNAVKYSAEESEITFSLMEQSNLVIFDIIDNGYGISEEDLPHIFDRFFRSTETHIVEQTGSGLGLAMTSEIIHLHGGEIKVQSEPGKGTQFTISIPREEYYLGEQ